MEKPLKDWGKGIPQYDDRDILEDAELHEFCTNIVARNMQDDGFKIDGIIINRTPAQVIATKAGQKYFVIVAGDIYPYKGQISHDLKRRFSDFCRAQKVVPLFASVGLMSSDEERATIGLALKQDEYLISYDGNEDLSNITIPNSSDIGYRAYCMEQVIKAYKEGDFKDLYPLFDDEIKFKSQWVLEPIIGKKSLIEYFEGKGATLRKSDTLISGSPVTITCEFKKTGNLGLMFPPGKVGALLSQNLYGKTNWMLIIPQFNEDNKLIGLSLNSPDLFEFKPYYAFE